MWKNILTKDRGNNTAVYVKYIINVTNKTGKYANHKITLFQSSGLRLVHKNGARISSNEFIGGGNEINAEYRLSG